MTAFQAFGLGVFVGVAATMMLVFGLIIVAARDSIRGW